MKFSYCIFIQSSPRGMSLGPKGDNLFSWPQIIRYESYRMIHIKIDQSTNPWVNKCKKEYWRKCIKFQQFNGCWLTQIFKNSSLVTVGKTVGFNLKYLLNTSCFLRRKYWTNSKVIDLVSDPNLFKCIMDKDVRQHVFSRYRVLNYNQLNEYKRTGKVSFVPC